MESISIFSQYNTKALPWVTVPLFSRNKSPCSLFPKIKILISYVPCAPKSLVSFTFRLLFLCYPEIYALAALFPQTHRKASIQYRVSHVMRNAFSYVNSKGADQTAHSRSLISVFVLRCIDSILPIVARPKILRL